MAAIYTEEDLINIKKAFAEGVLETRYGDKWIKYRSKDEMLATIAAIENELYPTKKKSTRILAYTGKSSD